MQYLICTICSDKLYYVLVLYRVLISCGGELYTVLNACTDMCKI